VVTPAREIQDAAERLRFMIASHARLVTRGQGAVTILVDEITALTPAQNRKITRHKRAYFDFLRDTLNQLKAEGKLMDVDTTAAAFTVLGMVLWPSRWFRQDGALTSEQVAEEIVKIAFHGLMRTESRAAQNQLSIVRN
jgi:AcrR family transcriptional regulator